MQHLHLLPPLPQQQHLSVFQHLLAQLVIVAVRQQQVKVLRRQQQNKQPPWQG